MSLVLSIEETNRLRDKVGLRPIPIPENEKRSKKDEGSNTLIIELSISETNTLRDKLGLKLIPNADIVDQEHENFVVLQKKAEESKKALSLISKLEEKKTEIKTDQRLASGGILERIQKNKYTVMDFDTWLDKVGSEIKKGGRKKLQFKSKKEERVEPNVEQTEIKIAHNKEVFSEVFSKEKSIILTAKDVGVLEDANDEFENRLLKREDELRSAIQQKQNNGKLISLDIKEENSEAFVLKNGNGVNVPVKRKLESLNFDIDDSESEDEGKKVSKFLKRDVFKFRKTKKDSTLEKRKFLDTAPISKEFKPLILDEEDGEDDVEELDKILKEQRKTIFSTVRIREPELEQAKKEYSGEVFDERLNFIDNLQVETVDNKTEQESEKLGDNTGIKNSSLAENIGSDRYRKILEADEDNYNTLGISKILTTLNVGGQQMAHAESKSEVNITYTDDKGNALSTKDAFKFMSRRFHGSKKR